jgi:CubicO group peptidase (beta-lactamase class C family)
MKPYFDQLDKHIRQNNLFNGILLVAYKDEIVYSGCFGHTNNPTENQFINQNSVFELASVSKQFTAYTALKTFKITGEGIDTDIQKYLPNFPYEQVTARTLLNHTSGLPDYFVIFDQHWDKTKIATNNDVLNLLVTHHPPALFKPTTNWEYSNTAYVLLALLIEVLSSTSFDKAVQQQLFEPLKMKDSLIYNRRWKPKIIDQYAFGTIYNSSKDIFELPDDNIDYNAVYYLDGIQGDGTVNSTALDLLKWNNEMLLPNILDKDLIELATTNTETQANETIDYGMGWLINKNAELGKTIFHGGSWPGYSTYNSIYLDKGYSIISLCNQPKSLEIEQQLIVAMEAIVFNKSFEMPK